VVEQDGQGHQQGSHHGQGLADREAIYLLVSVSPVIVADTLRRSPAGLTRGFHPVREDHLAKKMDRRVKPGK